MNSVEDLLKQCNLDQRLLVERVLKFTEDREAKCAEREVEIAHHRKNLDRLAQAFFKDFVVPRMDSQAQWNHWKENILKHCEKEDERA